MQLGGIDFDHLSRAEEPHFVSIANVCFEEKLDSCVICVCVCVYLCLCLCFNASFAVNIQQSGKIISDRNILKLTATLRLFYFV